MDKITETLLKLVSDYTEDGYKGAAFNIRENGGCAGRQSTENIKIEPKEGGKGIDIYVAPGTKDEKVFIPACISCGRTSLPGPATLTVPPSMTTIWSAISSSLS